MEIVNDITWKKNKGLTELVEGLGTTGFQGIELKKASDAMANMRRVGAKIFLSFTSNMVTSGLRGFFAQLIKLGIADIVVTTVGGIEEDIMKAKGEKFLITTYHADDVSLHEKGSNRIGNLLITNESYERFETQMKPILQKIYEKNKRLTATELLHEIGLMLDDENSILYQASRKNIPIFCPAITDGALGFHLYMFQQDHPDFIIDIIKDFGKLILSTTYDEKKGVICLGGGISKHHTILGTLLNGGAEYAVYMTTAREHSGSMSGATTREAKSWGKIKDDADAVTVVGDVSVFFPLAMMHALDKLSEEGLLNE